MIAAVVLIVFLLSVRLAALWLAALFQLGLTAREFADDDRMVMTEKYRDEWRATNGGR